MKTLYLVYSFGGHGLRYALARAKADGGDVAEVKEAKARGKLGAYLKGSLQAMRGKRAAIAPLSIDWAAYDHVVLVAPIWASNPAPAIYSAADLLPSGKAVDIVLTSGSGNGGADKLRAAVEARGCTVGTVTNIKGDGERVNDV